MAGVQPSSVSGIILTFVSYWRRRTDGRDRRFGGKRGLLWDDWLLPLLGRLLARLLLLLLVIMLLLLLVTLVTLLSLLLLLPIRCCRCRLPSPCLRLQR